MIFCSRLEPQIFLAKELAESFLIWEAIIIGAFAPTNLENNMFICLSNGLEPTQNTIKSVKKNYNTRYQTIKMEKKYTIIRSVAQYDEYCDELEKLVFQESQNYDDIELLTLLIEKWDRENLPEIETDPVELIKALLQQNHLKSKDFSEILGVNKSTASRILNYQKGLSKNSIRILADYFSISQESLNKPYKLKHKMNRKFKNASLMNTKKKLEKV